MQQLHRASKTVSAEACAAEVLEAVPPAVWFIRRQMRTFRKGLTMPQFRALFLVDEQPSASLSAIADHLGASLPTASRIIGGLVRKGFVRREGCADDRRQVSLAITARGQTVLKSAWCETHRRMSERFEHLSAEQRAGIVTAMEFFKQTFGAMRHPSSNIKTRKVLT